MSQEDKWVKDLLTELKKKTKEELEPPVKQSKGSNLITPTPAESLTIFEALRAEISPYDIIKTVKRGQLSFSVEQIADVRIAWQTALTEKIAPVEVPVEPKP